MPSPASEPDERFLRRALRLAMNGRGRVEPNPMVGCVLARDGQIIGEGYHQQFGGPHAEPTALADCRRRGNAPAGATAYVTLEPCCHTNKKTPPCAPRLIEAKVARVVIGCLDPNPEVNGAGAEMLQAAGIEVVGPEAAEPWGREVCTARVGSTLEGEAKQLIAPFLARVRHNRYGRNDCYSHTHGRPYVTLKWAETADGKIAGPRNARLQISNEASSRLVHQLRARSDAILVGIQTVVSDDPMLTARGVPDPRPLLRAVLDPRLEIPIGGKLVASANEHPLTVYCGQEVFRDRPGVVATLRGYGAEVVPVPGHERHLDLSEVLAHLGGLGATHVLVESGGRLAASLMGPRPARYGGGGGRADRVWVFRSPRRLDDDFAPSATAIPDHYVRVGDLDVAGDALTEYLGHPYAAVPSADFVLAADAASSAAAR